MPELPEVERARAHIEELALGRRIAAVDDSDTYVCRPHAPGEIGAALEGRELVSANRRGKAMWCDTDGGPVLGLHLGMAGRIVVDDAPEPHGWDRFTLLFEDGGRLALRDKRRLGRAILDPDLGGVGPDAATIGVGAVAGQVLGGVLVDADVAGLGWRTIFLLFGTCPRKRATSPGSIAARSDSGPTPPRFSWSMVASH